MEKKESFKFFVRFLLLTIVTFLVFSLSFVLKGYGGAAGIIGVILSMTNIALLMYYTVIASIELFNHIRDDKKEYFDGMYVVDFIFAVLITAVFTSFYVIVIIS